MTNVLLSGFYTIVALISNPLYWFVILLVYFQYRRIGKLEKRIIGVNKESVALRVLKSSIIGIVGGILGSFVIVFLGITITANDFWYIIVLAVLLMMIHPRFLCFSYAGGIISILSLTLGYPMVNVPSIMSIVAILHLIESFLILIDGDTTMVPIFIERNNRIVGGFSMLKFWPIPFVVLVVQSYAINGGLNSTDWWPIFRTSELNYLDGHLGFLMAGVIAALGYGDMAVTEFPEKKVRNSAKNLFVYSCILLALSICASYYDILKFVAALFSPIAHEMLIQIGRYKDSKGKPIFTAPNQGVKILDIIPRSPAHRMGLTSGDVIFALNGFSINSIGDLKQLLFYGPTSITIEYINSKGVLTKREYNNHNSTIKELGVLIIPKSPSHHIIVKEIRSPLRAVYEKMKKCIYKK